MHSAEHHMLQWIQNQVVIPIDATIQKTSSTMLGTFVQIRGAQ